MCFHCNKRCLVYSRYDEDYAATETALTQKLESDSDERFICGNLLFDDVHHLSKTLVQK